MASLFVAQKYFAKQFHEIIACNCIKLMRSIIEGHIVF